MAVLDPTSPIGKMRLRVGDYSDLPIMPDEVYQSALDDSSGNLPQACTLVAQYILGALTGQTHEKLAQIEVFGNQWFENYLSFVKATIMNPNFMTLRPLPYTPVTLDEWGNQIEVPLVQFQKDWNANYAGGTQSQEMRLTASIPPYVF
jgi:hypothetical protein